MTDVSDALKGMTRRQLEDLAAKVDKELQSCTLCGAEGAEPYRVRRFSHGGAAPAAMFFCRPCFEKHRLPESRASETE